MSSKKSSEKTLFANRLKEARDRTGLSHDVIGDLVHSSGSHLANIESGAKGVGKGLRILLEAWIERVERGEDYTIPIRPESRVKDIAPRDTLPKEVRTILRDLKISPEFIPWVDGLIRILRDGGEGRRHGIQENIKAFLGDMEREGIKRARDAG